MQVNRQTTAKYTVLVYKVVYERSFGFSRSFFSALAEVFGLASVRLKLRFRPKQLQFGQDQDSAKASLNSALFYANETIFFLKNIFSLQNNNFLSLLHLSVENRPVFALLS